MDVGAKTCEAKQPKHLEMDQAIKRLIGVVGDAGRLMHKIAGSGEPEACGEGKGEEPSLLMVLDDGPAAIREECDRLDKILAEIRQNIF